MLTLMKIKDRGGSGAPLTDPRSLGRGRAWPCASIAARKRLSGNRASNALGTWRTVSRVFELRAKCAARTARKWGAVGGRIYLGRAPLAPGRRPGNEASRQSRESHQRAKRLVDGCGRL